MGDTDTGTNHKQDARLTVCRDCGFVEATLAGSLEDTASTEDDPGFVHYQNTGHNVASFEPANKLAEQWGLIFTGSDGDGRLPPEKLWELATGQEVPTA